MYPPGAICRQLYSLHPQLRLAWDGRESETSDKLNAGSFALVQLYHVSDAGKRGDETTYFTFWNPPGHYMGPVFNKDGGGRRDWDPLFRVPIFVANLKDFDIPQEYVFDGRILDVVKEWLVPASRRFREAARQAGKNLVNDAEEIAREATDYLWHQANRSDATSVIQAYKHSKEELKAWDRQRAAAAELKNYYNPLY